VSTTQVRLVLTSAAPGTSNGFVQISELQALGDRSTVATSLVQSTEREHGSDVASDEAVTEGCAVGGRSSVALLIGVLAILYYTLRRWRRTAA
jgi:Na+-translocating ferredoxin:NAD+ oxidoreductase RnfD subunit